MKDFCLHEALIKAMEEQIPKKTKLADFIAETLFIEKETAYRRIRGEVQFSLREAGIIARQLNISIDNLLNKPASRITPNIVMGLPMHYLTGTYDQPHIEDIIRYLNMIIHEPGADFGAALSGIPFSLFLQYSLLARFFRLKYVHHIENAPVSIPFENIKESDAKIEYRNELYLLYRQFPTTCYIWDRQIIQTLINDIKYAMSIRLIKDWEVQELKNEIYRFLDDLEDVTAKGAFPETGNKFELYISDTNIDVTYAYMCSEKRKSSMLSAFIIFQSTSMEDAPFQMVHNWVKSLKRFSTLVSGIGERDRILFFEEQRGIVDTL